MNDKTMAFGFSWNNSNPNYHPNPEYQNLFFNAQEAYFNDRLKAGKFLTVNDIFDALGIPRSVNGMVYGWDSDDRIELRRRIQEDGSLIVEVEAYNIYNAMRGL